MISDNSFFSFSNDLPIVSKKINKQIKPIQNPSDSISVSAK